MSTDNTEYDDVLGERLAGALRAEAASIDLPTDTWARFQDRDRATSDVILEAPRSAENATGEAGGTRGAAQSTQLILPGGNEPGAPFAATYPDHVVAGRDSAVLSGTVELVGQCVAVRQQDGSTVTPLFPFTQVGTAQSPVILVLDGRSNAAGDPISLSGGQTLNYQGLPSRCPRTIFIVGP